MNKRFNKTPTQAKYEKVRKQLENKLKGIEKRGYVYVDKAGNIKSVLDLMPKIPKRIAEPSIRNIENLSKNIYKKIKYAQIDAETGEYTLTSGVRGKELEASKAAKKGVKTKQKKQTEIQAYKRGLSGIFAEYDKALKEDRIKDAENLKPYIKEYLSRLSEIDKKFKQTRTDFYYSNGRLYEAITINGTKYEAEEIADYAERNKMEDDIWSDQDLAEGLDEENREIEAEIQREIDRQREWEEQQRVIDEQEAYQKQLEEQQAKEQAENIEAAEKAGFITEEEYEEPPDTSGFDDIMKAYEEAKQESFDEIKWRRERGEELTEADEDEIIDIILNNALERLGRWAPPEWFNEQMIRTQESAEYDVVAALMYAKDTMDKKELAKRLLEYEDVIGEVVDAIESGYISQTIIRKAETIYYAFAGSPMDLATNTALTEKMEAYEDWAI